MAIKFFFVALLIAVATAQLPDLGGVTGGLPDAGGITGGIPVDLPVDIPVGGGGDSEGAEGEDSATEAPTRGGLFNPFTSRFGDKMGKN